VLKADRVAEFVQDDAVVVRGEVSLTNRSAV
jgi:hypothetical protein